MNLFNWWGSLKNQFAFSDHSFTRLAAFGQKSWIFFLTSHVNVLFILGQFGTVLFILGKKSRGHRTSKIVKSRQSYSNGHLPYYCSIYCLERALMRNVACEVACALDAQKQLVRTSLNPFRLSFHYKVLRTFTITINELCKYMQGTNWS